MASDMLTAKKMQEMLQVDRSTIYRMAETGRLPAVKIGKQWRFPSDQVDIWLKAQSHSPLPASSLMINISDEDLTSLLPLECVQLIQDTFADALGVMAVVTDMDGNPITEVSHTCGLFDVISKTPNAVQKCIESWHTLASTIDIEPKYMVSHLGLLCARGLIRVGHELKGMVVIGGIAPPSWPPAPEEIQAIADEFDVDPALIASHLSEVFYLTEAEKSNVLSFVQRIANIMAHIVSERRSILENLELSSKSST